MSLSDLEAVHQALADIETVSSSRHGEDFLDAMYDIRMTAGSGLAAANRLLDAARAEGRPSPEPKCETCGGRGEIGGWFGQTAESGGYVTEPCPDCAIPSLERAEGRHRFGAPPEPVVNPTEAWCDAYADWYYQGGR